MGTSKICEICELADLPEGTFQFSTVPAVENHGLTSLTCQMTEFGVLKAFGNLWRKLWKRVSWRWKWGKKMFISCINLDKTLNFSFIKKNAEPWKKQSSSKLKYLSGCFICYPYRGDTAWVQTSKMFAWIKPTLWRES